MGPPKLWQTAFKPHLKKVEGHALRGKTIAVDMSVWLHKIMINLWFAYKFPAHADRPWQGLFRYRLAQYVRRYLESFGVDFIIAVFDGRPLPAKGRTNVKRTE